MFTGQRNTTDQETEGKKYGFRDSMGVYHQNPATNEQVTKYRLGALTVGYGSYRVGVNSEHVRHAIQNAVIHRMIGDNEFVNTSWDWKGYSQYRTSNGFTSW